ncbi:MAG: iron(III) transport system ATP-binding protein [Actinomycetota bacterium]|jgi:ABC-type Fe3+/spermidine/putrescine transport system ATPase subunit|nr:iron(III) transport system ATP-binding protein [Actinomycetota bacterium]
MAKDREIGMTTIERDVNTEAHAAEVARGHRVRVRGVRKRYGAVEALAGIDLDIEAGKFMVLLGPSGSGKSTLIRGIAGIERFDSGTVQFGEATMSDQRKHSPAERRDLSMVFQDYALWPHMTVEQNVGYALRRRHLEPVARRQLVNETVERVGLEAKLKSYPGELSGGQQQRVALARALVARPALLLFDEPLSNLDADLRERLRVEIATLTREFGATALYITHDQSEAFALADEIGVLRAGVLEQRGTPEQIFRNPATPFVAQFTGIAGSFSGRAAGDRDGYFRVRVGDHELPCTAAAGVNPGVLVDLLVRPTATSLAVRSATDEMLIPGIVVDVAFRGRGYEHVVETGYGRLTSVFDTRPWSRGSDCAIRIDPDGCIAYPHKPS